ncbi:valine--tRNA ligase [Prosthecobacter sp.]|uniref:valine--tRNA ligase n=1 Tax=Prosthecobacter sp. TaxID=1965333 RepID=UPI001E17148C|nr:valine--tRNA ligase [Prosthecobacter sp.]MCB1279486.1 valine--tRNA ligase [Prosthecobacter sp.]
MPELEKTYTPADVEARWYQRWLDDKCFEADPARVSEKRPAYSIVIPPPNVTGILTLGHVLNNTIQDILARRARMLGKEVLWLPGTDHAGIATQNVVEKTLKKQGVIKHRDDLGREGLVAKIWEWKEKHGGIIIEQLKKLGASCDWSRERFTFDDDYNACVMRVFVDLYKKGLIYRGKRMVNWCPSSLTALSDEEVVMKAQNAIMYHFKVEVVESDGTPVLKQDGKPWELVIATTRPEVIPGDTAIAVNPQDERYTDLIGKHVRRPLPIEKQELLPIIADDHVDFSFGTGVLKVTPAHDKADYEIYLRHEAKYSSWEDEQLKVTKGFTKTADSTNLSNYVPMMEPIDVMHPNGVLNELAGKDLAGMERFAARKRAAELLAEIGSLVKEEPYQNNLGYSERADVPIESRLSEQWFLKYPSVKESQAVVANGEMKFHPDRWAKVYDHWMTGLQDWCISRQVWWGHRVPVWSRWVGTNTKLPSVLAAALEAKAAGGKRQERFECSLSGLPGHTTILSEEGAPDGESWIISLATASDQEKAIIESPEYQEFEQDPDVLDTWFSSWLWPFATMGWPEKTSTLKAFYPTTDLVTGPDIIFFWVARMIMAGFEWMGELPFKNVYFTGIIRDKQGRKMSKSLGNSPDPLELIASYSADALRFGIMRSAPLGQDICFDEKNVELGRNFCTKLWNAARFRQMQGGATETEISAALLSSDDKWILLRLNTAIAEVSTALEEYRFSDATATLYRFFWSEYCDWYVEASKAVLQGADEKRKANTLAVIDFVLGQTLRLFHPFLPFITEELWHGMGFNADMPENQGGKSIMFAPWPKPLDADELAHFGILPEDEKVVNAQIELVTNTRSQLSTMNIPRSKQPELYFEPNPSNSEIVWTQVDFDKIQVMLNAKSFEIYPSNFTPISSTTAVLSSAGTLYIPLEGLIDVEAERARIGKELAKAQSELEKVTAKLADEKFTSKVPQKVLDEHQQRKTDWREKLAKLKEMMAALG